MPSETEWADLAHAVLRDDLAGGRQSAATLARIQRLLQRAQADRLGLSLPCTSADIPSLAEPLENVPMPENVSPEIAKEAIKEAMVEWLDAKFAQVGKWTLSGIAAAIFSAIAGLVIHQTSK